MPQKKFRNSTSHMFLVLINIFCVIFGVGFLQYGIVLIEIEYLDDEDVWVVLFSDACVGEVFRCTKPIFGSKKGPKLLRIQVHHKTVHRRQKTTN